MTVRGARSPQRKRNADERAGMAAETGLAQPNADYSQILAGNYGTTGTMVLTHELDDLTVSASRFLRAGCASC
jgi:hypothetical protein